MKLPDYDLQESNKQTLINFPINAPVEFKNGDLGIVRNYCYNSFGELILVIEEFETDYKSNTLSCYHPKHIQKVLK